LEILTEYKLFLCPEKCEFHRKQIEYLRLVILKNKIVMDPVKVTEVHEWLIPEKKNSTQWLFTANPCLQWNGTTRSTVKRCSLSSAHWKSGGIFWKEPDT